MSKILFIDCETGGINENETSLLTIAGIICEGNSKYTKSFHFGILEEYYRVMPAAMKINKIDLVRLAENGINRYEVARRILEFCKENFGDPRSSNYEKIRIGGHNVAFDVRFLKKLINDYRCVSNLEYDDVFSHRNIDTYPITGFLNECGFFKGTNKIGSLQSLCDYFEIENKNAHNAFSDVKATAEIYFRMKEEMNRIIKCWNSNNTVNNVIKYMRDGREI